MQCRFAKLIGEVNPTGACILTHQIKDQLCLRDGGILVDYVVKRSKTMIFLIVSLKENVLSMLLHFK